MFIVAAMAVMLVGATALATDSAFADGKKKYGKNQATSQANACGNGKLPMYVFCQNTNSQVQGEENGVALDGVQRVEKITKTRKTAITTKTGKKKNGNLTLFLFASDWRLDTLYTLH